MSWPVLHLTSQGAPWANRPGRPGTWPPRRSLGAQVYASEPEVRVAPPSGFRPPSSRRAGFLPANPRPPPSQSPLLHTTPHHTPTQKLLPPWNLPWAPLPCQVTENFHFLCISIRTPTTISASDLQTYLLCQNINFCTPLALIKCHKREPDITWIKNKW